MKVKKSIKKKILLILKGHKKKYIQKKIISTMNGNMMMIHMMISIMKIFIKNLMISPRNMTKKYPKGILSMQNNRLINRNTEKIKKNTNKKFSLAQIKEHKKASLQTKTFQKK